MKKHLLESKVITDEQWEEYQMLKQTKEMALNKIGIVNDRIKNKDDIESVIKDINDITEYFKNDEVWQEYCKMDEKFMNTYNTCLLANVEIGEKKEIK